MIRLLSVRRNEYFEAVVEVDFGPAGWRPMIRVAPGSGSADVIALGPPELRRVRYAPPQPPPPTQSLMGFPIVEQPDV